MIIKRIQTISNIFTESGELESSTVFEQFTLQPEGEKLLKNLKTGALTAGVVCVNKKDKLNSYIEVSHEVDSLESEDPNVL